jgi:uncharacterized protein (DUF305 family)
VNHRPLALLLTPPILALALAACGQGDHSSHAASPAGAAPSVVPSATASDTAAIFNQQDTTFASNMIQHHRQAVEMADVVSGRSTDQKVIDLAAKIKAAQEPEITTMNGWLKSWGMPEVEDMSGMDMGGSMPGMMSATDLADLTALKGSAFDQKFLTMMIAHHEGAIAMAKEQVAKGQSAPAKALAQQVTADQTAEIAQLRGMLG